MWRLNRTECAKSAALFVLLLLRVWCPLNTLAEDAELLEAEKLPSLWIKTIDARAWSGYKDNVLLGNQNTIASPFLAGGVDLTFMRLPIDGWECVFTSSGEYIRYLSAPKASQEANEVLQGQFKKSLDNGWKAGLAAEYLYFNQVFDNSIVSTQFVALPVEGHTLTLRPAVAKDLGKGYRLEFEVPTTRQWFDEFIDNYWEMGPKLTFGREYGKKSDISVSYQFTERIHDNREARDADGNVIPGQGLQFRQHELAVVWRHFWDEDGQWRTLTKLSLQRNEDNGGGFYDFLRPFLFEQLRYRTKTWEIKGEARYSFYQYDREHITDLQSPIRHKTYLRFNLRAEKNLTKSIKIFGQYEYERAFSNLDIDQYTLNSISAGLDWEF